MRVLWKLYTVCPIFVLICYLLCANDYFAVTKQLLIKYSRTPEMETADCSQSHAGVNLSEYQTDCLLRINSSTTILII